MIWPANVIASVALAEWPDAKTATVAVAIALEATGGDDGWLYEPSAATMAKLMGVWAVPFLPEMEALELNPFSLRDNAKLARIMTGPSGDEWDWSVIYRNGNWKSKLATAKQAIEHPALGVIQSSPIPVGRVQNADQAMRSSANAVMHMLSNAATYFRGPLAVKR